MKCLVTGGAGFIGSHLVDALLARGDEVVVLDNFDDFYDPERKRRNLRAALASPGIRLVEGDIRDRTLVEGLLRSSPPDVLIHLAARAGVRPSIHQPLLYTSVNVEGTVALLEACRQSGVSRFVFASSSSVYGGSKRVPFREDEALGRPISPYAATKVAGELLAHAFSHLHGTDVTCLRYFTVYGPRQRPEMAIHRFVRRIVREEPIPVYGDAASRRDYTYVGDVVRATILAAERAGGFRVYNVGGSQPVELGALIAAIGGATGREPRLEQHPEQPGDVPATWADTSLARAELGWEPQVELEEGLERFVQWYTEEGAAP
jgi:UDP-glucuronate 4-epimerase